MYSYLKKTKIYTYIYIKQNKLCIYIYFDNIEFLRVNNICIFLLNNLLACLVAFFLSCLLKNNVTRHLDIYGYYGNGDKINQFVIHVDVDIYHIIYD